MCSNIAFVNQSWNFSMFLNPNRKMWFLNISRRDNWINIIKYSFFFSWYWFFNFFFNRWVIFKPLLLREINMSSKWFTERSYYLRVKSIFSAKFTEASVSIKDLTQSNLHYRNQLLCHPPRQTAKAWMADDKGLCRLPRTAKGAGKDFFFDYKP